MNIRIFVSIGFAACVVSMFAACDSADMGDQPTSLAELPTKQPGATAEHVHASKIEAYVCPMHPNIVSNEPGVCPICGMDLQPKKAAVATGMPGRSPVDLTERQRQLINVRTAAIERAPVVKTIRTVGIMELDDSAVFTVSAWTSGRIEKLYVNKVETDIRKGDRLYSIYSPDLYSTMQEYVGLLASSQSDSSTLIDATEMRLSLLGLSEEQLASLRAVDHANPAIDVLSPAAGRVTKMTVREGSYVKTGDPMYTVSDLSRLWLVVTVYESELSMIKSGMEVTASTPAFPGAEFNGRIALINHSIAQDARAAEIRVNFNRSKRTSADYEVSNKAGDQRQMLLPEMYMNVDIEADLGEQIVVPAGAVFNTGEHDYVFIEEDEGLFVPKKVLLGTQAGPNFIVLDGLKTGMNVVIDGNFLLDSESQFRAAGEGN